jgi:hypothetical protein
MLGKTVLISLIALLAAGYCAAPLLSPPAGRRRDARAFRRSLRQDVESGRYRSGDPSVVAWLEWCDKVARTGSDLPTPIEMSSGSEGLRPSRGGRSDSSATSPGQRPVTLPVDTASASASRQSRIGARPAFAQPERSSTE